MSTVVASIVGFSLFFVSEILPLLPIPTNGILDTFVRGFSNAFKSRTNDVQMAREIVKNPTYANIINTLSNNSVIKSTVDNVMTNPKLAYVVTSVQNNPTLLNGLNVLISNKSLIDVMNVLINDIELCNSVILMLPVLTSNKDFAKILQNTITNPTIINNIYNLSQNPRLNTVLSNVNSQSLPDILNIIEKINNKPELIKELQKIV